MGLKKEARDRLNGANRMTAASSCPICCLDFTAKVRKAIACPFCAFGACMTCVENHLTTTGNAYDPKCMNPTCAAPWSQEFIDEKLTKTFRFGPLKQRRADTLMEREMSLLPATTGLVERELEIRALKKRTAELVRERKRLEECLREVNQEIRDNGHLIHTMDAIGLDMRTIERRLFVRKCPVEDCRGFLSTQWRCDVCKSKVCKDCHELLSIGEAEECGSQEHRCKPEDVESAKAIAKETRPCPKCAARIFKIDGCDQMFCTACHTAFSWKTGHVEVGRVHNPHYYEWQRQTSKDGTIPREPGDEGGGCNALPDVWRLRNHLKGIAVYERCPIELQHKMDKYHRMVTHAQYVEMPRFRAGMVPFENRNADLRVKYLLKEISEKDFRTTLFRRAKTIERQSADHELFQMLVGASTDLLVRAVRAAKKSDIDDIEKEFTMLRKYFNKTANSIAKRFGSKVYLRIDMNDWSIVSCHDDHLRAIDASNEI